MENFDFKNACFFTGHRFISNTEKAELDALLEKICARLYTRHGVNHFISGGALGFDTLAAEVVLRLKKIHPDIKLHMFLPCRDQSKKWSSRDKLRWEQINSAADEYRFIHDGNYMTSCMQLRNRLMVECAYFGIAFCKRKNSGTYSTVQKAIDSRRFICVLPSCETYGELPI